MAIRELTTQEVQNVSGGTFCLFGGLLSWKLKLVSSLFSWGSSCTPKQEPTPCNTGCNTGC
ncbi:hypothetical protein [Nitrogeniibacter aestuarii]|uniref:hypothetical protein n=1 Tax=Nitrogeniibacter aestuarii TaxID=2815343 RepID=UPI001D107411|nr:hypothetical protein [Nitrogeniibacter aestuarii]